MNDSYLGSGKFLANSIAKHGAENHSREILESIDDRASMMKREKEVVNEEMLLDPLCMNLKKGGEGGLPNWSKEQNEDFHRLGALAASKKQFETKSKRFKKMHEHGNLSIPDWFGKKHSEKTKTQMSETRKRRELGKGVKNSQFGTKWICKNDKKMKVKKEILQSYLENGWKLGRNW